MTRPAACRTTANPPPTTKMADGRFNAGVTNEGPGDQVLQDGELGWVVLEGTSRSDAAVVAYDQAKAGTITLVSVGDLGGLRGVTTATPSYKGRR